MIRVEFQCDKCKTKQIESYDRGEYDFWNYLPNGWDTTYIDDYEALVCEPCSDEEQVND